MNAALITAMMAAAVSAAQGPAGAAEAEEILARAAEAYRQTNTLKAEFVQRIEIPALEQRREGRGVVYQKKPNFFLMRFEEPAGDVVVADGEHFWMYHPSAQPGQVIKTRIARGPNNPGLGGQFVSNPSERYAATYVGREEVGGRAAHLLALVPKFDGAPFTLVRVWIDASDHLVRKFEVHEVNDSVRTLTLTNLESGVQLPDDLFQFSPPEGVEVFSG